MKACFAVYVVSWLAVLIPCAARGAGATPESKPNLIIIIADDLGFGDVSCNGTVSLKTPNIDRLAAEGIRFTSGYSSASTCTPTRFSLLTGQYAFRTPGSGIAPPNAPALIRPGTETIASALKRAGYTTAAVGKWHLGLGEGAPDWNGELRPGPLEIGFDRCFLLPTTNDRVPQVFVEDHRVRNLDPADPLWVGMEKPSPDHPDGVTHRAQLKMDWSHGHNNSIHNGVGRIGFYTGGHAARFRDEDLADAWAAETRSWITANKERPFFLYFASHGIHVPRVTHERFQGKSGLGPRGDAILEFDWNVGQILDTLEELGIAENTLVVLCSDNGPVLDDGYKDEAVEKLGSHLPSGPFRGGKYSVTEGGTRTPFLARWKGVIPPGVSDEVISTMDLAASFATIARVPNAKGLFPDSEDLSALILGRPEARGRAALVTQDNNARNLGFRMGPWKLVRMQPKAGPAKVDLYDLSTDPGETKDLAAEQPERVAELETRLDRILSAPEPDPR